MAKRETGREFMVTGFRNGARIAGIGISYDDYSEESGNKKQFNSVKVRFPHDKCSPESLNGPVIIVQEGRKKAVSEEHCVCCDEIIPEGRQVCPHCEDGGKKDG